MTTRCRECGTGFAARRDTAEFCGSKCRMAFNQRRRERGCELYDAMMGLKFSAPGHKPPPGIVDNLLEAYRDADKHARAGRASWQSWGTAQTRIPMRYSKEGDKR